MTSKWTCELNLRFRQMCPLESHTILVQGWPLELGAVQVRLLELVFLVASSLPIKWNKWSQEGLLYFSQIRQRKSGRRDCAVG